MYPSLLDTLGGYRIENAADWESLRRPELMALLANTIYGVRPAVVETTHNKHIAVSAPIIIEKIAPGKGIRYTAMVKADRKLKDGTAHFKVFASEKKGGTQSSIAEFDITTRR